MLYMSHKLNYKQVLLMGASILVIMIPMLALAKNKHIQKDQSLEIDPKLLCSQESEKHLSKLEMRGETRFTDYKFDTESVSSSDVEFTDLGESGRRRGRKKRKIVQLPAKPEYGKLLIMKALGKEKNGWRNLVVKCGVNKGKLATFTYEILAYAPTADRASAAIQNTVPIEKSGAIEMPRSAEVKENN